eukprot:7910870-Alexandrium_andersonii.AAC.1
MSASLVGSEMCIRDRCKILTVPPMPAPGRFPEWLQKTAESLAKPSGKQDCLLYTSDAADDM